MEEFKKNIKKFTNNIKKNKILLFMILITIIILTGLILNKNNENNENNENKKSEITGIIQIGAHTGEEAPVHSKRVGNNMVWIEAQPDKLEELKQNVEKYGHISIQGLLWNKSGEKKIFNITNNSVSSSILEPYKHINRHGEKVKVKKQIQLETITYLDLVKQYPLLNDPKYNFLILDCQGAEYEVLLGIGKEKIQQFDKLEVEISNSEEYKNQKQQPEITKLLKDWGYKCVDNCDNKEIHGISIYVKK